MGEVFAELEAVVFGDTAPLDRSLGKARDSLGRFVKQSDAAGKQAGSALATSFAAAGRRGGGGFRTLFNDLARQSKASAFAISRGFGPLRQEFGRIAGEVRGPLGGALQAVGRQAGRFASPFVASGRLIGDSFSATGRAIVQKLAGPADAVAEHVQMVGTLAAVGFDRARGAAGRFGAKLADVGAKAGIKAGAAADRLMDTRAGRLAHGAASAVGGLGRGAAGMAKAAMPGLGQIGGAGLAAAGSALSALRPALAAVGPLAARAAGAFSNVFGRAFSTVGGLASRAAGALFAPFRNVFSKLGMLWANMPFVVAGAGAAGIGFAVKAAGDLESSMIDIRKVTGYSEADMARLGAGVKALATDSNLAGVSLEDILKIVESGGRLGVGEQGVGPLLDYAKAMAQVSVSMDDIPIDKASEAMGQILNVFGLGADKARNFASVVDALADSTTASSDGIFDVTQRMSGAATAIKMTLPQTAALATAVLDMGDRAHMAGSALQRIMITMAKDPTEFARVVGMTAEEFARLKEADPLEALKRTLAALSGMEGAARFTGLDELGVDGVMAQQVMLGLTQRVDALGKLTAVANNEMATGAHILDSVAMNSKKTWSQLTLLYNNVQLTAAELGGNLLPILKAGATAFGELAADVGKYLKENQGVLSGWAAAVAEKIRYVGLLWQEWPTFMSAGSAALQEFGADLGRIFEAIGKNVKTMAEYLGEVISTAINNAVTNASQDLTNNPLVKLATVANPLLGAALKSGAGGKVKKMPDLPRMENPFMSLFEDNDPALKAQKDAALKRLADERARRDAEREKQAEPPPGPVPAGEGGLAEEMMREASAARFPSAPVPAGAGGAAEEMLREGATGRGAGILAALGSAISGAGRQGLGSAMGSAMSGAMGDQATGGGKGGPGWASKALASVWGGLKDTAKAFGEVGQEVLQGGAMQAYDTLEAMKQEVPNVPELEKAAFVGLEEMAGRVQLAALDDDPAKEQLKLMQDFIEGQNKMIAALQELLGEAFPAVLA